MPTISALINARLQSTRLPRKLLLPFAASTLVDIALAKLDRMDFVSHRYFGVAEAELRDRARIYGNIEILDRKPEAVAIGYNDHRQIYAHYEKVESDYIMWINPCHPLLSLDTIKRAVEKVLSTGCNSYTSVVPTTDWIFSEDGEPITNTQSSMLSTAHSRKFYKVAHAFHVFTKAYFLRHYQVWSLTRNDPSLIEIPEGESYDVNTQMEFEIAKAAYVRAQPGAGV